MAVSRPTPANPDARRALPATIVFPFPCALVLLAASIVRPEDTSRSALWANAIFLLVSLVVGTAVHEAGHAAAARLLHLTILRVVIGCGPVVHERRIGAVRFVLHAVPITGLVQVAASSTRWLRTRLAIFFAAGALANAVLVAASLPLIAFDDVAASLAVRPSPALAFAVVNAMYVAFNLFPLPAVGRRAGLFEGNDGWKVLGAPIRSQDELDALVVTYDVLKSSRALEENRLLDARALVDEVRAKYPKSTIAQIGHTDVLLRMYKWQEAIPILRALLGDATWRSSSPRTVPILANNLAWALFNENDPKHLGEADHWSNAAVSDAPKNLTFRGTRGAVLLALGSLDEAETQLTAAFVASTPAVNGRIACCLAMLHSRRGNRDEARAWLEKARALKPEALLLARAERSVTPPVPDEESENDEALADALRTVATAVIRRSPGQPPDAERILESAATPSALANLVAANLDVPLEERTRILATRSVAARLSALLGPMARQLEIVEMRARVNRKVLVELEREHASLGSSVARVDPRSPEARALVQRHREECIAQELEEAGYDVDRKNLGAWVTRQMTEHGIGPAMAKHSFLPVEAAEPDAPFRERLAAQLTTLQGKLSVGVLFEQLAAILEERTK